MGFFRKKKVQETTDKGKQKAATPSDPVGFAAVWQEAWNSHEAGRVLELCAEDVVWDDPLTESPLHGHAAVRLYLEDAWKAFPDMTFSWPEQARAYSADGGERLALHWHVEATMLGPLNPPGFAPTKKRFKADGVDLLHLRDGKVSWYLGFFDRQGSAQQLGIMPAPGSRGERMTARLQRLVAKCSFRRA